MPRHLTDTEGRRLADAYHAGGTSLEVARAFGVCSSTVLNQVRKFGGQARADAYQHRAKPYTVRHRKSSGYISVGLLSDDPWWEHASAKSGGSRASRERRWMLEHHYVMAQHLGRPIVPPETVHHKNTRPDDNRLENLELWASNHPAGGRVVDLLAWARDILKRYEPILHLIDNKEEAA